MPSISSLLLSILFACFASRAYSGGCDLNVDQTDPVVRKKEQVSRICNLDAAGNQVQLQIEFDFINSNVYLKSGPERQLLEKIGPELDPRLIEGVSHIRFLPVNLQAYRSQGILLYTTSRRSVRGDGGGQCGAGAEDYLNALDVNRRPARVVARVLIGSCRENIELRDVSNFGEFKSFWLDDGDLAMQFLFYDDRCQERLLAKLDVASRRLRFYESRSDAKP